MSDINIISVSQRRQSLAPIVKANLDGGISEALGAFGKAYNLSEEQKLRLEEQEAAEQKLASTAKFDATWAQQTAEYDRAFQEAQTGAGLGANGFTQQTKESARAISDQFLASVPEELRPRYEAQAERFVQSAITAGYQYERDSRQGLYLSDLEALQQTALDEIMSGQGTVEDWQDTLIDYLSASPLQAQQTADLINNTAVLLEKAQLGRDLEAEALQVIPLEGQITGVADGSDIVAAGMSGTARTVLNMISGEESDSYNLMYSPDGRRIFDNFKDHPNQPTVIKSGPHAGKNSTAAGRYQFINGTWKDVAARAGLPDFSPANQDRGAWFLASETVQKLTGMDITAALSSGDEAVLRQVKTALGTQWEGVKKMTFEDFRAKVSTPGSGTPSALLNDPRYASVPYQDRLQLQQAARATAEQAAANQATQRQALLQGQFTETLEGIKTRELDLTAVQSFVDNTPSLSTEQRKQLSDTFETVNKTQIEASTFASQLTSPSTVIENNVANRQGLSSYFEQAHGGLQAVAQMDEKAVAEGLAPIFARTGMLPENTGPLLTGMLNSPNRTESDFAANALALLAAAEPTGTNSFANSVGAKTAADLAFYQTMAPYLGGEGELTKAMKDRNNPLTAEQRGVMTEQIAQIKKDDPDFGTPSVIIEKIAGDSVQADGFQQSQIAVEYNNLFAFELQHYGDPKKADEAATKRLSAIWGASAAAPNRLMKHPPEKAGYPPLDGSFDYIPGMVKQLSGVDSDNLSLELDYENSKDPNGLPSYNVFETRDGVAMPLVDDAGRPIKITPTIPNEYQAVASDFATYSQAEHFRYSELKAIGGQLDAVGLSDTDRTELQNMGRVIWTEINAIQEEKMKMQIEMNRILPGIQTLDEARVATEEERNEWLGIN